MWGWNRGHVNCYCNVASAARIAQHTMYSGWMDESAFERALRSSMGRVVVRVSDRGAGVRSFNAKGRRGGDLPRRQIFRRVADGRPVFWTRKLNRTHCCVEDHRSSRRLIVLVENSCESHSRWAWIGIATGIVETRIKRALVGCIKKSTVVLTFKWRQYRHLYFFETSLSRS